MNPNPDNPPAFPSPDTIYSKGEVQPGFYGMTLRDWFAGQALAGIIASFANEQFVQPPNISAGTAYEFADAMLAERSREKGTPNEPKP